MTNASVNCTAYKNVKELNITELNQNYVYV